MMNNTSKRAGSLIQKILPQLAILSLIGLLYLLSLLGLIPSPDQLNNILVEKFKTYGLPLIAICAFLENLVGVNAYFPGAFTILTGMALTAGNPNRAILTYFAIYLPSYLANILSYYFGFLYKKKNAISVTLKNRNTLLWFFFTYWHPQLAALTAFSVGSSGALSQHNFIKNSVGASLFWSVFWGVIIYHFGLFANVAQNFIAIFLCYVVVWTAIDIYKWLKAQRTFGE